jgi:hypothetical protein
MGRLCPTGNISSGCCAMAGDHLQSRKHTAIIVKNRAGRYPGKLIIYFENMKQNVENAGYIELFLVDIMQKTAYNSFPAVTISRIFG